MALEDEDTRTLIVTTTSHSYHYARQQDGKIPFFIFNPFDFLNNYGYQNLSAAYKKIFVAI